MAVMRCPICGSKMKYGICEYCKIKAGQVSKASNKLAKKAFKTGKDKDEVYYSSTMPEDVNKLKLILLTVFLGYAGAGYFYIGKYARAWSFSVVWALTFIVEGARLYLEDQGIASGDITKGVAWFLTLCCALTLIIWASDLVNFMFKRYTVPVVLANNDSLNKTEEKKIKTNKNTK